MNDISNMFDDLICNIGGGMKIPVNMNVQLGSKYKCISVRQPWADLIVKGIKNLENRQWTTSYRGLLLIHAPLKFNKDDYGMLNKKGFGDILIGMLQYPLGAIVGAVELEHCFQSTTTAFFSEWAENDAKYWWKLVNAVKFLKPIPWKGQLSIFDAHDEFGIIAKELSKVK